MSTGWRKNGSGSPIVQASTTNGNVKLNGAEVVVYDDSSVRSLIGGSSAYISGKKINCIGDSITAGNTGGATPWTTQLQTNYGCTVRNYGVSGCTLQDNASQWSIYYRYPSMDNDADIVIVWGGWNDINIGLPLGVFADRISTSFYGALHLILSGLQSKYLGKKIFVCTLLDTTHSYSTVNTFNNAVREVAEYYSISVIDMSKNLGINARNVDVKTNYIPDGTHPNTAGNRIVADVIAKFINSH